jgi:hypothetical protein
MQTRALLSNQPGYCDYCGKKAVEKLPDDEETGEPGPKVCGQHLSEFISHGNEFSHWNDDASNDTRGQDAVDEYRASEKARKRAEQQAFAKSYGTPRGTVPRARTNGNHKSWELLQAAHRRVQDALAEKDLPSFLVSDIQKVEEILRTTVYHERNWDGFGR